MTFEGTGNNYSSFKLDHWSLLANYFPIWKEKLGDSKRFIFFLTLLSCKYILNCLKEITTPNQGHINKDQIVFVNYYALLFKR